MIGRLGEREAMRVLLVEDDPAQATSLRMMLESEGFDVDLAGLGEDGLEVGRLYDYALIVLDLMLPDMDGHEVLRRLRSARVATPVLILSGLTELDHKIKGLGSGADDYLTKPFAREELIARIHAIVRRSQGHAQSTVKVGKLTVRLGEQSAEVAGKQVKLTAKEFGVLELLALRRGQTVSKEQFLTHLYGGLDEPDVKIIDVYVCKLRQKIAARTGGEHYIATEWGRGYSLRQADPARVSAR
jgi:two-component system cell cycle response regulator CtrA